MTKNKTFWLIGLALIGLGLFLFFRLYNLDKIPVFVDEAIYIRWSQVMRTEATLRFLPLQDGKQPLFMWLTIPFLKFISDPLIAGRTVSVLAGFGSLLGIALLSYTLFSNILISTFSALIYALVPFTVFFDRMALADSLLAMFGIWSLIFAIRFAKNLQTEDAMYLGMSIGGGLLTKSPAAIYYVWFIIALIFFVDWKTMSRSKITKIFWGAFLTVFISQAMYAVLRLGVGFQMIGARNGDYVYTLKEVLTHPLVPLVENLKKTGNWLFLLLTPSILLLGVLGYLNFKTRRQFIYLIIISAIPLLFQAAIARVYTSRYALYAIVPLLPVAGLGLHWLFMRRGALIKASIAIFIALPLIISYVYTTSPTLAPMSFDMRNGYLEEWTAGYGQKEVADYLLNEERQGKKVVVFTEGFFGTLPDGIQIYTEGHQNITVVGSDPHNTIIPQGLINTSKDNSRFYVINSSRSNLPESEKAKLELIKEFPKPARLDGTHESLLFYRLK